MEIKAKLNKPYTDKQRIDFIVSEIHSKGYKIKETETALEAWGLTAEEIASKNKETQRKNLISQLDVLDVKTIRALRAIQAGTSIQEDIDRLAALEEQAAEIRKQIQKL